MPRHAEGHVLGHLPLCLVLCPHPALPQKAFLLRDTASEIECKSVSSSPIASIQLDTFKKEDYERCLPFVLPVRVYKVYSGDDRKLAFSDG